MKPVNGQIIDDVSKLESLEDMNGESLNFKQDKDIDNDLVYTAKGSDGKTYSAQLSSKTLIVSLYDTPKEKKEKKAIEERGEKIRQGGKVTGTLEDAKSAEKDNKNPEKESKSNKDNNNKFFKKN
jgi:hypothetical protein